MTGINNTPPESEFRRYSSWGRTRGLKNVAGAHGAAAVVGTGAVNGETAAPTTVSHGYATENQRFLHVALTETGNNSVPSITVWAYSHASGIWGILHPPSSGAAVIAGVGNSTVQEVFEIAGVDRVYFQETAGDFLTGTDSLHAACSTF